MNLRSLLFFVLPWLAVLMVFSGGGDVAMAQAPGEVAPGRSQADYESGVKEAARIAVRGAAANTLLVSLGAASVTYVLAIATAFSILYFGRGTRRVLRQVMDTLACFSPLIVLLLVYSARDNLGQFLFVFLAIAIYPLIGRPLLVRVSEAAKDFHFTEAKVLGHSPLGVFFHYAWPRFLPLTLPFFFLGFIQSLAMESMFSSLGLMRLPAGNTWGGLIHSGLDVLLDEPWLVLYSGFAIISTTLAVYLCVPLFDRLLSVESKTPQRPS